MAGGETTRRKRQWNLAEGEDLGFDAFRPAAVQGFDQCARRFERWHPALHAVAGEAGEGGFVVDVQVRTGDEILPMNEVDRTQVVGFDHASSFVDQPP